MANGPSVNSDSQLTRREVVNKLPLITPEVSLSPVMLTTGMMPSSRLSVTSNSPDQRRSTGVSSPVSIQPN